MITDQPNTGTNSVLAPIPIARNPSPEPILPGFYPDPTICRVGSDYFLATSSFEYFPGVPVFHSTDLATWRQIGNILDRPSQLDLVPGIRGAGGGIYAPTLRHHDGKFWLITTNMDHPEWGQLLVTANDPAGPWSDAVFIPEAVGIDPDLTWLDDGRCLLTWSLPKFGGIVQSEIDPVNGTLIGEPRRLWSGTGLSNPEGPHLYRRGEWWYLLIAEGGTHTGHAISVARSASPTGPFDGNPANPLLTHGGTRHELQATGHGDLVERPDGSWAMVHLGVRQWGAYPRYHVNGRETFLRGIDWVDDWPVVVDPPVPVRRTETGFDETFAERELSHRWITPSRDPNTFTTITDKGLQIAPAVSGDLHPFIGVRVRDRLWRAEVTIAGDAMLLVRIDEDHWVGVERCGTEARARMAVGPLSNVLGTGRPPVGAPLAIQSLGEETDGRRRMFGPDRLQLGWTEGEQFVALATIDGRYLSTEVAGGFTGRIIGVGAIGQTATVRRFRYSPG